MDAAYLVDIIILLAAAVIAVPLFRAVGLGAVPGFLVAGVLVGPSGLALIDNITEIAHLAELGVVLLLFVIGIELKPSRLWLMRRLVLGLGTLQLVVTGALITAGAWFLFDIPLRTAILVGPALALSSTAFVLQLLSEQKTMNTEFGRASVAVLLLQDFAVVPLLALAALLVVPELTVGEDIALALIEALAILLLVILGGRYLLQPVLHRVARSRTPEVFTASAVLLVLGAAMATEKIGLSMAMGAFIAGLLIADSSYRHQVMAEIHPFRGLLLGLFFMSMGMSLRLDEFFVHPWGSVGLAAALMLVKAAVLFPLTRLFGLDTKTGAAVALILSQSGEFALVLFAFTFRAELLSDGLFQDLLLIVLLSMLATPPVARLAHHLVRARPGREAPAEAPEPAPIVLAGFGRVGHRIGRILTMAGRPYVAIDHDATLVADERGNGYPVFYGDAQRPEVLLAAGAGDANVVIVTLDDFEAVEQVVTALKQAYPDLTILARGHDLEQCRSLRQLGVSVAVSENLEASLELAHEALMYTEGDKAETEALMQRFRQDYYAQIDAAVRNDQNSA